MEKIRYLKPTTKPNKRDSASSTGLGFRVPHSQFGFDYASNQFPQQQTHSPLSIPSVHDKCFPAEGVRTCPALYSRRPSNFRIQDFVIKAWDLVLFSFELPK